MKNEKKTSPVRPFFIFHLKFEILNFSFPQL